MNMKNFALCSALMLGAFSAPVHAATLVGDEVTVTLSNGVNRTDTSTVVVGAGDEGNFFQNQFFDFGANSFSVRSTNPYCGLYACAGEPVFYTLTSLDFGAPITGVNVITTLSGVMTSFTSTSVTFSFSEQPLPVGTYLSATFDVGTAAVPEPSMMLLGFLAIGGALRANGRRNAGASALA